MRTFNLLVSTFVLAAALCAVVPTRAAMATTIVVPGYANPWLAGMPDGSSVPGDSSDHAPAQSPIEVPMSITGGDALTFSVSGIVQHGANLSAGTDAEGAVSNIASLNNNAAGENGIANVQSPINALLGVFLDADAPNSALPPAPLDFSTQQERNFLTLVPELSQPFYIGDGRTSAGEIQSFIVPAGATRLFLGTMDAFAWHDNTGTFEVTIPAPEPTSVVLALSAVVPLTVLAIRSQRQRHNAGNSSDTVGSH